MQPLRKAIQTAHAENKVWQQALYRFLLQYRATPHSTTQFPASELLFNRTVRGKLPILHPRKVINKHRPKIRKRGNITSDMRTERGTLNRAPSTWETQFW